MFDLNDQTRWILGRPNFTCSGLAELLRRAGHKIERKSEDEQAAVIHWMLGLWETHGDDWRIEAQRLLEEIEANHKEAKRHGPAP